jgi:hypothetical protein
VGSPFKLKLRKTTTPDDAKQVEEYLHQRFRKYRMQGEWFDLPPELRDFEIPTHIDDAGRPNVSVELSAETDTDNHWGELLDRVIRAMTGTKHRTAELRRIQQEWQEFPIDEEGQDKDDSLGDVEAPADIESAAAETASGKIQCSHCGHHFDRNEGTCPMCGGGSFTDGTGRY